MSTFPILTPEQKGEQWLTVTRPCPSSGRHLWIASATTALVGFGIEDDDVIEEMIEAHLTREQKTPNEIRNAIRSARRKSAENDFGPDEYASATPNWPKRDAAAVAVVLNAPNMPQTPEELSNRSTWQVCGGDTDTDTILGHLFPGNPLICCGWSSTEFKTQTREKWGGGMDDLQFVVPSAMSKPFGRKKCGTGKSQHTEDNTGTRQRIVVEFDKDEHGKVIPVGEQCALLWHLKEYLPLILVVHSGGKSLQGWFKCGDESEAALLRFMRYAVSLGGDKSGWTKSQFFRMPGGVRDKGDTKVRQVVHYFEPEAMNEKTEGAAAVPGVMPLTREGRLEAVRDQVPPLNELLDSVEKYLCKYVVFGTPAHAPIIALWAVHAHAIEAFDFTPYLHILSPMKQCGKSRTLEVVQLIVPEPWFAISPSEAVLYRKIEAGMPTLLLDEVDTIFTNGKDENREGLRAILNAGFNRSATVPRCDGPQFEVKEFRVFCPKIIAGIGKLPDTVADRSIPIVLSRKTKGQVVEKFRARDVTPEAEVLNAMLTVWAQLPGNAEALRKARPQMPDGLSDRQADICEPLLAIADAAGGEWPQRARAALVEVFSGSVANDDNLAVQLLSAIRDIFTKAETDKMSTEDLLTALLDCEGAPWVSWWEKDMAHGNKLGPASRLAKLLKPFGILSWGVRLSDGSTPKGYKAESFADAWERYL